MTRALKETKSGYPLVPLLKATIWLAVRKVWAGEHRLPSWVSTLNGLPAAGCEGRRPSRPAREGSVSVAKDFRGSFSPPRPAAIESGENWPC